MPYLSAWEKEGQLLEQNDVAKRYSNKQNDISLSDLPIRIKESVSSSYANLEDTPAVKKGLKTLGYYQSHDGDLTQYPDAELFKGIRSFQKDNNLYADGKMLPNGPTLNTLNIRLGEQLGKQLGSSIADGIDLVKGYKDNQSPFLIKNWFSSSDTTKNSAEQSDATGNDLKQPDISVLQSDESEQDTEMTSKAFSHTGLSSGDLTNVSPTKTSSVSQNDLFAIIECPSIKTEYVCERNGGKDWDEFCMHTNNMKGLSSQNKQIFGTIFAMEGGTATHHGSDTRSGITATTLSEAQKRGWIGKTNSKGEEIKKPADLDIEQRVQIYAKYLDAGLGGTGESGLAILDRYDGQIASALADTIFRAGVVGGGKIIERAINEAGENTGVDGKVQKNALGALDKLLSSGKKDNFLNALADERNKQYKEKGDLERSNYFRPGNFKNSN